MRRRPRGAEWRVASSTTRRSSSEGESKGKRKRESGWICVSAFWKNHLEFELDFIMNTNEPMQISWFLIFRTQTKISAFKGLGSRVKVNSKTNESFGLDNESMNTNNLLYLHLQNQQLFWIRKWLIPHFVKYFFLSKWVQNLHVLVWSWEPKINV